METLVLEYARVPKGVLYRIGGGRNPAVADWPTIDSLRSSSGAAVQLGVLLRLLEDGQAALEGTDQVRLSHEAIARLDDRERRAIALPASAPVTLELRASGSMADPDFAIEKRMLHSDGRPVVAPIKDGCFLEIGGAQAVLPDPLFSLWEAVDDLNRSARNVESRMLAWAKIAAHLPEGVRLGDDELRAIRVVLATGFSLNPFRNESGEPDVDPILGRWVEREIDGGEPERTLDSSLFPEERQRDFARRFREFSDVKHRYALGAGIFVVLSPKVERALRVVRAVQKADAGTRRRFLTRPSAFLRDALEQEAVPEQEQDSETSAPEDRSIDDIFFDEGMSDRVKGIGLWEPKVLPWLQPSGETWLPGDDSGLQIDDQRVPVPPERAPALLEELRRARAEGRESVEFDGKTIPATEATEKAVEDLIAATKGKSGPAKEPEPESESRARLAVLIIDNLEQLGFRLEPRGRRSAADWHPPDLKTSLLAHQEKGIGWLLEHWASGSPGALLADDMGLGKTLQALAFLACVREEMESAAWPKRPILVVAPTGLLRNWRDEHTKHFPGAGLGTLIEAYGGGLRALRSARDTEGREMATGLPSLDLNELKRADWVLTTYETLRDYQHSFALVHWSVVVFDEAQKIKNPAAGMTEAAKAMKQDFALLLTGTPVENRIEDLWCIVDAARPGQLGALKQFSAHFRGEPQEVGARLAELRKQLSEGGPPAIMMRRLKEDHLEGLPSKQVEVRRREMPAVQANAYREAVTTARAEGAGHRILNALQRIRSVSLHPFPGDPAAPDDFLRQSARCALAIEILDEISARGEKALVFLESRAVQDALAEILPRRYRLRDRLLIINGAVEGSQRKRRVDEFEGRTGFDVMLLSPRAGGVGLTLTAANHVIHLARWWNPAVEDQCTDRVYRIGQTRPVRVYHVLAVHPEYGEHSFDVRLASLLERKRELNRTVLMPPDATEAELRDLFRETTEVR